MNVGTMKSNLVGRGSRSTDDCLQSSRRFKSPNPAGPLNPPSRWPKMCHLSGRDSNLQRVFQFSSPWVRLRLRLVHSSVGENARSYVGQVGKPFGLSHHEAGIDGKPCEYRSAIREPRPTNNRPATSPCSPPTSHFSPPGYACS